MLLAILLALAAQIVPAQRPDDRADVVARGGGLELTSAELGPVLLRRYAMSSSGREVLEHFLTTRLLERMAHERRMTVTDADVDRRVAELDRQVRANGSRAGIAGELASNEVDPLEFRELLRMAIVQERLCREALGLPPDSPLNGDQQKIWIEKEMADRGLHAPPPPWSDGVAGRCGDVSVSRAEYETKLRQSLPVEDVRETSYQLLVVKGIRARMPDFSEAARARAIDAEIEHRRREAEADPRYRGAPFERLLSMQGLSLEALRVDPAVELAAFSKAWVARTYPEDALRKVYGEERATFDGRHGEAVRARLLLLRAALLTNPLNPRGFGEAASQLETLARNIATEAEFEAAARSHSEESRTRARGGDLGWLTRVGDGLEELRAGIFADLRTRGPLPAGGRLVGPLRLDEGMALVWLGEARGAPSWDEMKSHVQNELRRRLIEDVLPRDAMVTFF